MKRLLKDLAVIQLGYQTGRVVEEDSNGTHRLLLGRDISPGKSLQWDLFLKFKPERNPELYRILPGDILFQSRGIDNPVYWVTDVPDNVLASSSFFIIRPNQDRLLPGYLQWWLHQKPCKHYFSMEIGVAQISFVRKETLARLQVNLPSLEEQERIQRIFHLWQQEQRLIKIMMEKKNILINELCFKYIDRIGGK